MLTKCAEVQLLRRRFSERQIVEAPLTGVPVVVKLRFSAFMGTALDLLLRRLGVTELVMFGTQYPNCIRPTVTDAVCLDYAMMLVTDATSAQTPEVAAHNIADLVAIGVRCVATGEYLDA